MKITSKQLDYEITGCDIQISTADEKLKGAPEGTLRVSHSRKRPVYYHCKSDGTKEYIKKSDVGIAKQLAEKEYYLKLKQVSLKLRSKLKGILKIYNEGAIDGVFNGLNEEKQKLITKEFLSDEEFANEWSSMKYEKMNINTTPFVTKRGEYVRSKTEIIIADILDSLGIPYRYEQTFHCSDGTLLSTDFVILDVKNRREIYFEHFGMIDDPDYAQKTIVKIHKYISSGLVWNDNFICTFESSQFPISMEMVRNYFINVLKPDFVEAA